jgi:fructose-specific phosphotransferase system IIA component
MMILTQILQQNSIKVPLEAKTKEEAIEELVDVLDSAKLLANRDAALKSVLLREKTRSTGIGSGIAIPHGKCKTVKQLVMAVGVSKEGLDFGSVDNKPVKLVLMILSPVDQTGPHIQALASISRLMMDETFKTSLEESESGKEVYDLFKSRS